MGNILLYTRSGDQTGILRNSGRFRLVTNAKDPFLFGNLRKCSRAFEEFLCNLRKSSENIRKSSENRRKHYVYIIRKIIHGCL